jgi:hypothetical protein
MQTANAGTFPFLVSALNDVALLRSVQDAVASSCARYLREGGYLADQQEEPFLRAYRARLDNPAGGRQLSMDFLDFVAEAQAREHSVTPEDEIRRMQKLLRARLSDRIHTWTFGPLHGRPNTLYEACPSLRACCTQLVCPAYFAGETLVHVASINPVAVLAATKWITHELSIQSGGDAPFVFPFMVDMTTWATVVERHSA